MASKKVGHVNIVAFDGAGGSSTISQIVILQDILARINWDLEHSGREPLELADLFQVMGGTGLGGVAAFLLGGLRMSLEETMQELALIINGVFDDDKLSTDARSLKLEEHVVNLLRHRNLSPTITLRQLAHSRNGPFLIIGCGVASNSSFRPLSTHPLRGINHDCDITVVQAIRATCASTRFRPVRVGPVRFQEVLVSCTGLYANPAKEIYRLIRTVFGDGISSLISLGNGVPSIVKASTSPAAISSLHVNVVAEELHRELGPSSRYYRFAVMDAFTFENTPRIDIGEIVSRTKHHLSKSMVDAQLDLCCSAMTKRLEVPPMTLKRLSVSIPGSSPTNQTSDEAAETALTDYLGEVLAWAKNAETQSRILLASDLPGCTEASIAERLSTQLKKDGRLAFVYNFSTENGKTPRAIDICLAAYLELCSAFVSLRPLLRSMRLDIPLITRQNLRIQWETLVVDILKRLHRPSTIILGGIEECNVNDRTEFASLLLETFCGPNAALPKFKVIIARRSARVDVVDVLARSEYVGMIRPSPATEQAQLENVLVKAPVDKQTSQTFDVNMTESKVLAQQPQIVSLHQATRKSRDSAQTCIAFHAVPHVQQCPFLSTTSLLKSCPELSLASGSINTIAVSAISGAVLTGHFDRTIWLWLKHAMKPMVFKAHTGAVMIVCFSPCGTRFASGSMDNSVRLWDINDPAQRCEAMTGHRDPVTCLDWSACGAYLVSGSRDHTLRLWDTETREPIGKSMSKALGPIVSVKFTADGLYVASGSSTGVLAIWVTRTRRLLARKNAPTGIVQVSWSSQGLIATLQSGTVQVWTLDVGRKELTLTSSSIHNVVNPQRLHPPNSPPSYTA